MRYKPRYWQAWGNISAIHMQSNSPRPALIAIKEAIKYTTMVKQWKLTANAIVIATAVGPDEYLYIVELAYVWLKYSENSHSATQDYSDGGASDSTVAGFATGAFWGFEHARPRRYASFPLEIFTLTLLFSLSLFPQFSGR